MADSIARRWWDRVAQIRNTLDASHSVHEAQAVSMERAVSELYSDACSPWFDGRAFLPERLI